MEKTPPPALPEIVLREMESVPPMAERPPAWLSLSVTRVSEIKVAVPEFAAIPNPLVAPTAPLITRS